MCKRVTLPVNVMIMDGAPSNERLSKLGVARISYGPIPYISAMNVLQQEVKEVLLTEAHGTSLPNRWSAVKAALGV